MERFPTLFASRPQNAHLTAKMLCQIDQIWFPLHYFLGYDFTNFLTNHIRLSNVKASKFGRFGINISYSVPLLVSIGEAILRDRPQTSASILNSLFCLIVLSSVRPPRPCHLVRVLRYPVSFRLSPRPFPLPLIWCDVIRERNRFFPSRI